MAEIDIDVEWDPVRAIPIPASFADTLLINGPCLFCGWSVRDVSGTTPASVEGSLLSPGAGATIATLTGLAGATFLINWGVQLLGAAAAADQDNFKLVSSAGLLVASLNAGAAGQYPQQQVEAAVGISGSISVQAIAAGTVGVTYAAQIAVIPISTTVAAAEFQDGNNPLGETSVSAGSADSRMFFDPGVTVRNKLNFHPVGGLVQGCVYARYQRNTG